MVFENIYINIGLNASIAALAYMIFFAKIQLTNRVRFSIVLLRALLVILAVSAISYKLYSTLGAEPNLEIFNTWRNIPEFGYKAVWFELLRNALPFVVCGFFLPLAFNKLDKIFYSVLFGILMAILLGIVKYLFSAFDIDEIWSAILGTILGYCLLGVIIWILPKVKCFDAIKMPVATHIFGVIIILSTYFACVGALVVDSSAKFVKLSLPKIEQQIPANIEIEAQIDEVQRSIMTYKTVEADPIKDIVKIAKAFEVSGEIIQEGSTAIMQQNKKKITAFPTGEWKFVDETTIEGNAQVPSDVQSFEIAKSYALKGIVPFFEAGKVHIDSKIEQDENGNEKALLKLVYLEAKFEGREIEGAGEIVVGVGPGGKVVSVEKFNADFEQYKTVKTISSAEAVEKIKQGNVYHTLGIDAKDAKITSAVIGYWLEEVKGILQPVWVFYGEATDQNGEIVEFKAIYPAMKY